MTMPFIVTTLLSIHSAPYSLQIAFVWSPNRPRAGKAGSWLPSTDEAPSVTYPSYTVRNVVRTLILGPSVHTRGSLIWIPFITFQLTSFSFTLLFYPHSQFLSPLKPPYLILYKNERTTLTMLVGWDLGGCKIGNSRLIFFLSIPHPLVMYLCLQLEELCATLSN